MDFLLPAKKPVWLPPLMPILLALVSATLLFSGCAHHDGEPDLSANALNGPAHDDAEAVKKATPLAAVNTEDNLQPSEGDIAIESEIKALERSGKWGKGGTEPAAAEGGLDMSKYDFPVVLNNQVTAYLDLFQGEQREMFGRWLARSTKYLPMIRRELAKAGLPQDLAYLSMIESGYTPTARSTAGAVGLWQFMRDTGKHYTLRIDDYIDERRHIEKSTKAAVDMLGELYKDFGDWHLAVAAYNGGPARVQNGLARFDAKTFWELADEQYLPLETKRYVPKLIAAIIIAKDPKKYGFDDIPYQPELNYDRLTVAPGLPLDAVALVAGCNGATIRSLNPELHRGMVPPNAGRYLVRIPVGSKDLASRNLALLRTVHDTKYHRHIVRRQENITTLCKRYGIGRAALLKANKLHSARLTPGRTLLVPYTVTSYALGGGKAAAFGDDDTMTATVTRLGKDREAVKKIADAGKSASPKTDIAAAPRREAMPVVSLKAEKTKEIASRANGAIRGGSDNNGARLARIDSTIVKRDRGGDFDWYLVKDGETLWGIAKKHNVSLGQIKKWNNLKSNAIHAGLRLKVSEA